MSNRINKPMLSSEQLVKKMRDEKGITFKYTSEDAAEIYLTNVNNYLRTAAYRSNYQKIVKGKNAGCYVNLDFAYLQELSTLDMHFRFLISQMCSDIEHDLKVQIIRDVETDADEDGYSIVKDFLDSNTKVVNKLNSMIMSPFTGDLLNKYFSVQTDSNAVKGKKERKIVSYDDCPIWVLCEFLTFGDIIRLYDFYYQNIESARISLSVLNLVRSLRNAAAHNNCILANLRHKASYPPRELNDAIINMQDISKSQRIKKLSCRPMLEFAALLYMYEKIVTDKVKHHRIQSLRKLFFERFVEKKGFFVNNDLIKSNYEFACKLINGFFPKQYL